MTSNNCAQRRRHKNEPVAATGTAADSLLPTDSSIAVATTTTAATTTHTSATAAAARPHSHSLGDSHLPSREAQLRLAVRSARTLAASRSPLASFVVRCCCCLFPDARHRRCCRLHHHHYSCSCSQPRRRHQIRWRARSSTAAAAIATTALGMCSANSHSAPPPPPASVSCTSACSAASPSIHDTVAATALTCAQPAVVSIMPRSAESIVLVLPATVVPTRPSKLSPSSRVVSRRWHIVYDVVAQMVVLPVVCVSVCSAVGLLLGLECIEKLPRLRAPWRSIGSVIVRVWGPSATPLTSSSGATPIATIAHHHTSLTSRRQHQYPLLLKHAAHDSSGSREPLEKEASDDGDAARRPLKKQRSRDDRTSSASERCVAASASNAAAMISNSVTTRSTRALEAASRVRKTRSAPLPPPPAAARKRRVFIWDLDETLVLFASLYTGAFAQTHGKEIAAGVRLGEQMMAFMLTMLERHFFFDDLHDADIDHITSLDRTAPTVTPTPVAQSASSSPTAAAAADIAARYARIRAIYERAGGAVDFLTDAHSEWFAIREALVAGIDAFSTGWLREARHVLELLTTGSGSSTDSGSDDSSSSSSGSAAVSEYENVNLLVTNTQLAPALCKCLIYQLDAFFPIESVYSSAKVHKQHCFEQILRTYAGDDVEFVAVGDGAEEEHVSRALGIRFHKIRTLADLQRLRTDLELEAAATAALSSSQ